MRSTCFAPCYRSAQLQSPSPLYVCRAGGTRGVGGRGIAPPDFRSKTCSMKRTCIIACFNLDFQSFQRPCMWGKKHQFMAKAGSPFEQGSNLWFWQKKSCVPLNLHKMFYSSYNHVSMWPGFFQCFYISCSLVYFNDLAENSLTVHVHIKIKQNHQITHLQCTVLITIGVILFSLRVWSILSAQ